MQDMLVDRRGRVWSPPTLARQYRYRYPADLSLASFAVRERGFIHVRRRTGGVEIAVSAGKFTQRGLLAAILALGEMPARIVLSAFDGAHWTHELFGSVASFAEFAEALAADQPLGPREPWVATRLDLGALMRAHLASLRPLLRLWESCRGRLPEDFDQHVAIAGHGARTILLRQVPESKGFVFERVPVGTRLMKPQEWRNFLGRDLQDLPDARYAAWAHRDYCAVAASGAPRLEAVRASTRSMDGSSLNVRYDRLMIPWVGRGGAVLISAVPVTRELSITP